MIPLLRETFNTRYRPEHYAKFQLLLTEKCGMEVPFRNCETPCFFPRPLIEKMATYGQELIEQVLNNADYLSRAGKMIPSAFRVPNVDAQPLFVQADFGIDEVGEPKLVEIQGFPSLYAYQPTLAACYREAYALDEILPDPNPFLSGLNEETYFAKLQQTLLGGHLPENVILLEIQPETQKTRPDFLLTEKMTGVKTVCLTDLVSQGNRLFYREKGKLIPVERIYNRVIVDELSRKEIAPIFDFKREYEVEWAGHPDWFYLLSKFSLPFFDHVCVPKTQFLSEILQTPDDLKNYVLKPLFSFAGQGVTVSPTHEQVNSVSDPENWILQEKVEFVPIVETPYGKTKVEIRVMYLCEEAKPLPVTVLIRMGRGTMMGVDQNREQRWVGASAGFMI